VTTVQQLLQRRRLLEASRVRHPRRVPKAVPPSGLIIAFTKVMRDLDQAMDDAILATLRDAGVVRTDDVLPVDLLRALEMTLERVTGRRALVGVLEHLAERVSDRSGEDFQRQVRSALGVNLLSDPQLAGLFTKFRDESLSRIRGLADEKIKKVRKLFEEAPVGQRVEVLERDIREATGATKARAALIARDQTLTLYSEVTQDRHKAAGIERFVWSTSRDQRVRPSHAELENKEFSYANPPVVEGEPTLPGVTAYQCRCLAIPVLPTA
jgi:SPP1 gp7 family putative phage head morphogenesis protein